MTEPRRLAGRFLLLQPLGEQGATQAWLAQDTEIGELVLLRLLKDLPGPEGAPAREPDPSWEAMRAACREARRLAHPNIARVFDVHRDGDTCFLSREYVQGVDATKLGERPPSEAFATFAQVAAALEYAGEQGVVHGDLKPSKILRDANGRARVVDFGLACALRARGAVERETNELASPQVRAGEAPRHEDDVYALGASILGTLGAAALPAEISILVGALCAERREDRPGDLGAVRSALEAAAGNAPTSTRSVPVVQPPTVAAPAPGARRATPLPLESKIGTGTPSSATPSEPVERAGLRNVAYAAGFAALAIAALLVFVGLPRLVGTPRDAAETAAPAPSEAATRSEPDATQPDAGTVSSQELQALREEVQLGLAQLEAQAVTRWASERFAEARSHAERGDLAQGSDDPTAALRDYQEARTILEEIASRRDTVLTESLAAGDQALAAAELDAARDHFGLVLAMEPDHARASLGLRRAEGLPEVLVHMRAGQQLENEGAPGKAVAEYRKALERDPEWAEARAALARAEAAHGGNEYQRHLSLALVALADSQLKTARTHFERASRLRPGSAEVADGMAQLRQLETSQTIARERRLADEAERAERFESAAGHYSKILQVQPNLSFAVQGLARSQELARRGTKIEALLADPKQLFERSSLDAARSLVSGAPASPVPRPTYDDKVQRLRIAIDLATTPIPVPFRSDGATEVVIRKVGTLGSFDQREVPLKPGQYVVVGRRNGFRDVLRKISVVPGRATPVVDVRCTDSI